MQLNICYGQKHQETIFWSAKHLRSENTIQTRTVKNWTSPAKYRHGIGRLNDILGKMTTEFKLLISKFFSCGKYFSPGYFYTFYNLYIANKTNSCSNFSEIHRTMIDEYNSLKCGASPPKTSG